ncbi:hypothetical protein [Streptomyces cahuitamycinicus]|uniref:hypothetical protein n=1 Tax=Streptomyces cahuitamycinicus TaxID=2070367 RepID=UPI001FE84CA3|nr:hypothetical protein [Streptomyces cahuitamycinicus]
MQARRSVLDRPHVRAPDGVHEEFDGLADLDAERFGDVLARREARLEQADERLGVVVLEEAAAAQQ